MKLLALLCATLLISIPAFAKDRHGPRHFDARTEMQICSAVRTLTLEQRETLAQALALTSRERAQIKQQCKL